MSNEKITGKKLIMMVLRDAKKPLSVSDIWDLAKKKGYAKLYGTGNDEKQKKAQIGAEISRWCQKGDSPIERFEKGEEGKDITYSLCERIRPQHRNGKNDTEEIEFEKRSIETSNGRKRPTNAQLPNGEVISWVNLLERYNLYHNKRRSAHIEWNEYVLSEKGLPNAKEVPKNGGIINKNGNDENIHTENCINLSRRPISANMKGLAWMTYIGKNIPEGTCYCCKIRTIHFTNYEVAHNKPFSKGGDETLGNIRPICSACNKDISNRYTIEEYIEKRGLQKD